MVMKIETWDKGSGGHFKKFIQLVQEVATGGGSKEVVNVDVIFNGYRGTVLECTAGEFSFKMKMPGEIPSLIMMQAGSIAWCSNVEASDVGEITDCQVVMTIMEMESRMTNPGMCGRGSFKIERAMRSCKIVVNTSLACSNRWSKAWSGGIGEMKSDVISG